MPTNRLRRLSPPPDDYRLAVGTEPDIEDSGRFWLPLPPPEESQPLEQTVIVEPAALDPAPVPEPVAEPMPEPRAQLWRRAPAVAAGAVLGLAVARLLGVF